MRISAPSKTFLFGEYGVLKNSPAALLNTNPRFELNVEPIHNDRGFLIGIHHDSPAGRYHQIHSDFFKNYKVAFYDPWNGSGGFGASSAQFAMLFALKNLLTGSDLHSYKYDFLNRLRNTYREIASGRTGLPPSGADVIAQWVGGVTHLSFASQTIETLDWKFKNLSFVLLKTKNKLVTHKHLEVIEDVLDAEYGLIAKRGILALKNADERNFILSVQAQFQLLSKNEFVAPETREQILEIQSSGYTLASKGCGAMGADVIFTVLECSKLEKFMNWAESNGMNVVSNERSVSCGIQITGERDEKMVGTSAI